MISSLLGTQPSTPPILRRCPECYIYKHQNSCYPHYPTTSTTTIMFPKVFVAVFVTLLAAVAQAAPNPEPTPTAAPAFEPRLEERQSTCFFPSLNSIIHLFISLSRQHHFRCDRWRYATLHQVHAYMQLTCLCFAQLLPSLHRQQPAQLVSPRTLPVSHLVYSRPLHVSYN